MSYPQQQYPQQPYQAHQQYGQQYAQPQQYQYQQPVQQQQASYQYQPHPQAQAQAGYAYQQPQQPQQQHVQMAHSGVAQEGEWETGLCSCGPGTTCIWSFCCPCVLMGRTQERQENPAVKDKNECCDPGCGNSDCMLMTLTSYFGFGQAFAWYKRHELRKQYHIKGGCCSDYWAACCCTCCALIQQDNHVRIRPLPNATGYNQQYTGQAPMTAHKH